MAKFLTFILLALFSILMMTMVSANGNYQLTENYGEGSLTSDQCPSECERRCSKTQYHKACITYCNMCCNKCLCVPPGFYGNKEVCPCYNNWKTKKGGPKCP